MKKKNLKLFFVGVSLLVAFALWTMLVSFIDVKEVGPQKSFVGFATLNAHFHKITGVNMPLYVITDWLSLVPIGIVFGFAILGLAQWIKRKKLLKVDLSILTLGAFYIILMVIYIFFEIVIINYRPILINGYLEASYPSSTTMLVMCVMLTSIIHFRARIKNNLLRKIINSTITAFIAFMVIGRLLSGVHWVTDIIGGVMLSIALVLMYYSLDKIITQKVMDLY